MFRVPGPHHGVYCSITERIREELEAHYICQNDLMVLHQVQLHQDSSLHEVIQVKLSGDGASFSRCSSFFLVSFAILNLKECVLLFPHHEVSSTVWYILVRYIHYFNRQSHTGSCKDARIPRASGNYTSAIAGWNPESYGHQSDRGGWEAVWTRIWR